MADPFPRYNKVPVKIGRSQTVIENDHLGNEKMTVYVELLDANDEVVSSFRTEEPARYLSTAVINGARSIDTTVRNKAAAELLPT